MALNTSLIMKFQSSVIQIKPNSIVVPPLNRNFLISKPYKGNHFMRTTNAKTSSLEPIIRKLRNTAVVILFTSSVIGRFQTLAARADNQPILTEESTGQDDAIDMLNNLMNQKFESGDFEESLRISKELVLAQPEFPEWKISSAMILKQMGETEKAFNVFDQMLSENPLEPDALFQNALLMISNGHEEVEVIKGLEKALELAKETHSAPVIRDVRLVIARVMVAQKRFQEAFEKFNELEKEDPNDWRIYFCKSLLFHCTDRNEEATEQYLKSDQLFSKATKDDGFMSSFYRMRRHQVT